MLDQINSHSFKWLKYLKLRFINSLGIIEGDGDAYGPGTLLF
jgi:hypothetical protein